MQDRQLRLGQRAPVQVAPLPVLYTLTRGGSGVTFSSEKVTVVATGGLVFFKAYLVLDTVPTTGDFALTLTGMPSFSPQVMGTMGLKAAAGNASVGAFINAGVITNIATLPDTATGDVLTIQGVL